MHNTMETNPREWPASRWSRAFSINISPTRITNATTAFDWQLNRVQNCWKKNILGKKDISKGIINSETSRIELFVNMRMRGVQCFQQLGSARAWCEERGRNYYSTFLLLLVDFFVKLWSCKIVRRFLIEKFNNGNANRMCNRFSMKFCHEITRRIKLKQLWGKGLLYAKFIKKFCLLVT